MMLGLSRRHEAARSTIPESKVQWLGVANGYEFGTVGDREYAFALNPSPDPGDYVPQRGEILVSRLRREVIDGSAYEHHAHFRGWPVDLGTYSKLAAKQSKPAEKPMRAWSIAAHLPVMHRREPLRVPVAPQSSLLVGELKAKTRKHESPAVIEVGGHEPPQRSAAGIIAWYASHGVELTLARGYLLPLSRKPLSFDDRQIIEKYEELLVGELSGSPLLCCQCERAAVDIAFPHAPLCAEHLGQ